MGRSVPSAPAVAKRPGEASSAWWPVRSPALPQERWVRGPGTGRTLRATADGPDHDPPSPRRTTLDPPEARWAAILDEAEAAARAVLEASDPPYSILPSPPGELGPLPPELAGRVLEVLALTDAAVVALTTRRDDIGRGLAESVRRPAPFRDHQ